MRVIPTLKSVWTELRPRLPPWLGGRGPFEGVYPGFDAIGQTDGHNQDGWAKACLTEAARLRDTDALSGWQAKSRELEPLVVALLGRGGSVRVVDFGGAIGFSYLLLKKRLAPTIE